MGFEPNAKRRLQLLWATTQDPLLRQDLRSVLEATGMSFVPSADLLRQIATCHSCEPQVEGGRDGLCESHRARWNLELCMSEPRQDTGHETLNQIMDGVLSSEQNSRALLTAIDRQLRALHLVWEAHERGVARLPERVAEAVRLARLNIPACIPGGERTQRVQQAS